MNLSRTDLIDRLADHKRYKKKFIREAIDDIFEEIENALAEGDKVTIRGFGTFETKVFQPHSAVHPETGERIETPAYKRVMFRTGDALMRAVREAA